MACRKRERLGLDPVYYMKHGLHITTLHVDGEFDPLQYIIYRNIQEGLRKNITCANEHVPDIECQIRVVEERIRAARHSLPFNNTPKILTVYIVFKVVTMLKYFLVKRGVYAIKSLKTIMYGETFQYKRHIGIKIGNYCQEHEHEYPKKSQV